jgi:spore coat protein JC
MVTPQAKATLNDIGTEELAHLEMVGTMVHQLTDGASPKEMAAAGLSADYVNHGLGIYPQSAGGIPFSALAMQSKGDPITDLYENMAADAAIIQEQR